MRFSVSLLRRTQFRLSLRQLRDDLLHLAIPYPSQPTRLPRLILPRSGIEDRIPVDEGSVFVDQVLTKSANYGAIDVNPCRKYTLGNSVTVAQLTLDQLVMVQIHVPQLK